MNYKSIIVASAPRTGGMWTYNVLREIFFNLKKKIIPLNVPQDDNQMLNFHFKNLKSSNDSISIIKIHKLIKKEHTNKTKILINIRDPRDAVISYKRFMKFKNYSFQKFTSIINYQSMSHTKLGTLLRSKFLRHSLYHPHKNF